MDNLMQMKQMNEMNEETEEESLAKKLNNYKEKRTQKDMKRLIQSNRPSLITSSSINKTKIG